MNPVARFYELAVLGMAASGYAAALGSGALDWVPAILTGLALVLRVAKAAGGLSYEAPRPWVNAATLACIGFFPLDYALLSESFVVATIHLVFYLAVIKVLTATTPRDFSFVQAIAFLLLLAGSILSLSPTFFVCMVAFLVFTVAALASREMVDSSRGKRRIVLRGGAAGRLAALTAYATAGIVLLTAGLFFLLPRTARAALERLVPEQRRVAGFANEVVLGQTGRISTEGTPVIRVRFLEGPAPQGLRWKGAALAEFNGTRWFNSPGKPRLLKQEGGLIKLATDEQLRRRDGARPRYEVLQHGTAGTSIFVAGIPEYVATVFPALYEPALDTYMLPSFESEGARYIVYSFFGGAGEPPPAGAVRPLTDDQRNFHLRLNPVDHRVHDLARALTAPYRDDLSRARAIERHLREKFQYSLDPPEREAEDPLAQFLFERKKGHCEYFASAMAVLLRSAWIPSRVVTGFLGGEDNPLTGWRLVRASDAHSWVEAWVPGRGWVTFDPTPPDPNPRPVSPWPRLTMYLDAADTFWQNWVVGYSLERQLSLAWRVGDSSRGSSWRGAQQWWDELWRAPARWVLPLLWMLAAAGLAAAGAVVWPWWTGWRAERETKLRLRRGESVASDASFAYSRMLAVLRKRGWEKPAWMTPAEFAVLVPETAGGGVVKEFTTIYNELRFGGHAKRTTRLAVLLDELERMKTK